MALDDPGIRTIDLIERAQELLNRSGAIWEAATRKFDRLDAATRRPETHAQAARRRVTQNEPRLPAEELRELYLRELLSALDIARKYKKSTSDIYLLLEDEGIPARPRKKSRQSRPRRAAPDPRLT